MTDLNTDVRYIKGIGEKKAQALAKLGVLLSMTLFLIFRVNTRIAAPLCPSR